jgi:caffeoyl-CoA O-methyltransferase
LDGPCRARYNIIPMATKPQMATQAVTGNTGSQAVEQDRRNSNDVIARNILSEPVEEYLDKILPKRDPLMREMEEYARRNRVPIIGTACARLLALVTEMTGAKRIFEMGSAIGYSTIWFARAAGPRSKVYYTDGNPENARIAAENFRRAKLTDRIKIQVGDARDLLRREKGPFDIILIDIDKEQYPEALRVALPRLKHGGLLIADNVLWRGLVAQKAETKQNRGIQKFNKLIYASRGLYPVIVPLRDGVAICRKR